MKIRKVILSLWFAMTVMAVAAQPEAGDPNGGGKPAPISGIEWLIVGGGVFGAIRTFFKSKGQKRGT